MLSLLRYSTSYIFGVLYMSGTVHAILDVGLCAAHMLRTFCRFGRTDSLHWGEVCSGSLPVANFKADFQKAKGITCGHKLRRGPQASKNPTRASG